MSTGCKLAVKVQHLYTVMDWRYNRGAIYFLINHQIYVIKIDKNNMTILEEVR